VQGDGLNFSQIATVVCVPLTNLRWADAPGNVLVRARVAGLPKDSVANASQILTLDRNLLTERAGKAPRPVLLSPVEPRDGAEVERGERAPEALALAGS
jgi:mRNA interferase MazF